MPIPEPAIYQLKVAQLGISPMIWRRLLIHGNSTIADLHFTLQIAMGWSDDHLHRFRIHGKQYGIARINERFIYEYDFTDGWQHQIRVETILAPEPHRSYPVCTGGKRACPPEDCGGPLKFMMLRQHYSLFYIMERLLEIIEDKDSEEYDEGLDTLRYWFRVDHFDRKAANRRLYDHAHEKDVFMWA